jgi:hypothetical protein
MTGPEQPDDTQRLYRVTLRAVQQTGAPAVVSLRRLLKALLRGYGFRCL